jgi:hypothetical protein
MSAAPFKVKAVYEYKSAEPDDLNFPNGQIITVTVVEDDDWYTGNYVDASGSTREGLFPKNFVEKYEPAIPSRPKRVQPKVDTPAEAPLPVAAQQETEYQAPSTRPVEVSREAESLPIPAASPPVHTAVHSPPPATGPSVAAAKSAGGKPPPPVAEKPSSNSFRDRIAAFNKTGAPPPTPFKPTTQNNSSPFINKKYVAPPPSKNAYVHPPREQPPQKVFNRGDDPDIAREEPTTASERAAEVPTGAEEDEDAPKPMTLKERMALLQKQQLEQAERHAEGVQKKEKIKRPKKPRVDSSDNMDAARTSMDAPVERVQSNETLGKGSVEFADDEAGPLRGNSKTSQDRNAIASPPPPSRELVSDTNDADDSGAGDTEDAQETSTEEERPKSKHGAAEHVPGAFTEEPESTTDHRDAEAGDEDEEEEADDTDEDPEVKRRREIRDRMAKFSGGMGMVGMFGPPGMAGSSSAKKTRVSGERTREASSQKTQHEESSSAPPVPIMPMPGMTKPPPPPANESSEEDESSQPTPQDTDSRNLLDGEDEYPLRTSHSDRAAAPIPPNRGLPPPSPSDARRPPSSSERPMPNRADSKDFASAPPPPSRPTRPTAEEHADIPRPQSKGGPPALPPAPPRRPTEPSRLDTSPPNSPSAEINRFNRGPPPVPMSPTIVSPQTRAPPPPPPGQPPSRRSTNDSRMSFPRHPAQGHSEVETDGNEGDVDTDISNAETHKPALTAHHRDSSLDEDTLTDEASSKSPIGPPARTVPPVPNASAPRDGPPPLPSQGAHQRKSSEGPRSVPPPVPPPHDDADDDEYDPFKYNQPVNSPPTRSTYAPVLASPMEEREQDSMYDPTPTATRIPQPPIERGPPALPSSAAPLMSGGIGQVPMQESRTSTQASRPSTQGGRPSIHNDRGSLEQGRDHTIMASDIDLGQNSMWWTKPNTPPPSLQGRQDILYEIESSTSTRRGGKSNTITDVYALYLDYSQTTIHCTFDPSEPQHASIEQKHDRPPPLPRRDQLEAASSQFGSVIASSAAGKLNTTVGDGTPQSFILELLKPLSTQALMPIGTRSFGAPVYANMANTSIQVTDEIRPGDIVTFRTAKFNGKHGPMHQKYSAEAGMGGREHVAVVAEWDGTKKKIKVWEQGREKEGKKGKVREESWRMGDLRSGDVRVWRVMSRGWVGWDTGK